MTYASLLVHLQSGQTNDALLLIAGQMAARFNAHVIGIAASQPMLMVGGDGYVAGDVFAEDQRHIEVDLKRVEDEFRAALSPHCASLEWRSSITIAALADYLSFEARSADLVMTGSSPPATFNLSRGADPGALVMQSGRPVLIVPRTTTPLRFEHALLGWKDTREARRAALDALPMLGQTGHVTVLEIAARDDLVAADSRVKDVATWLARHGVAATSRVVRSDGDDVVLLSALAIEADADLIVAGAYGHSRLREWVMGGVTRDLLLESTRCVLASH